MGAYILRRLLLMIPTLLGIMVINFVLVQFLPGGPIEQILSQIEEESSATDRITGGGGDLGASGGAEEGAYQGGRGLPPDFIADLERQFGFDKPPLERFFLMMGNYLRFDFGESYFRSIWAFARRSMTGRNSTHGVPVSSYSPTRSPASCSPSCCW